MTIRRSQLKIYLQTVKAGRQTNRTLCTVIYPVASRINHLVTVYAYLYFTAGGNRKFIVSALRRIKISHRFAAGSTAGTNLFNLFKLEIITQIGVRPLVTSKRYAEP